MKTKSIIAAVVAAVLGGAAATAAADGCTGLGRASRAAAPAAAAGPGDAYVVYPEADPDVYPAPAHVAYPEASDVVFADGAVLRFDEPVPAQAAAPCAIAGERLAAGR